MTYRKSRNSENMNRYIFQGTGIYDIPKLRAIQYRPCRFIGFNYAIGCKQPEETGIHFFLDDYQFERLWQNPDKYISILKRFRYVLSPDFSLYTDFPRALQIYNHFRKHWLGAYFQMFGIRVIPSVCWSDSDSFSWCFDGEPRRSCVAVSSVGCMGNREYRKRFLEGYEEMQIRLEPTQIIFYGFVPEECKGNIIGIEAFQDTFNRMGELQ